ncbi:MAG: GNAT family N-acetyltransferase [Prochloraceae cyanobacterium]|nr:GNAT family N-acetyltransferase [Prochloraceae cyanobacterium]
MKLIGVEEKYFLAWKQMRQTLYSGLETEFHEQEMQWIFTSDDKACFIFLSDRDEIMGFLEISLRNIVDGCLGNPVGYIEGIYLKPQYRGCGYGREIINYAADWFRSRGCQDMATDAEIDNINAQEFYKSLGFQETYCIVEFKKNLG